MSLLTEEQAYAAMFRFLECYYDRTNSDEIGGLLGTMSMLDDGFPADIAVRTEWQEAIKYSRRGGKPAPLTLGHD